MTPRTSSPARPGPVGEPPGVARAAQPQRGRPTFTSISTSRTPPRAAASIVSSRVDGDGDAGVGAASARACSRRRRRPRWPAAGRRRARPRAMPVHLPHGGAAERRGARRPPARAASAVDLNALTCGRSGRPGQRRPSSATLWSKRVDVDHQRRRRQSCTFDVPLIGATYPNRACSRRLAGRARTGPGPAPGQRQDLDDRRATPAARLLLVHVTARPPGRSRDAGRTSSSARIVTMRLRRTPRRSWRTISAHSASNSSRVERPALAAGVDADDVEQLGPVDVADAGDDVLVHEQRADGLPAGAGPGATTAPGRRRAAAGRDRAGPRSASRSSGDTSAHDDRPREVPGSLGTLEPEAHLADRRRRRASPDAASLPNRPRWTCSTSPPSHHWNRCLPYASTVFEHPPVEAGGAVGEAILHDRGADRGAPGDRAFWSRARRWMV